VREKAFFAICTLPSSFGEGLGEGLKSCLSGRIESSFTAGRCPAVMEIKPIRAIKHDIFMKNVKTTLIINTSVIS